MESEETLYHAFHPLKENDFIDKAELDHIIEKDYWMVKEDLRVIS